MDPRAVLDAALEDAVSRTRRECTASVMPALRALLRDASGMQGDVYWLRPALGRGVHGLSAAAPAGLCALPLRQHRAEPAQRAEDLHAALGEAALACKGLADRDAARDLAAQLHYQPQNLLHTLAFVA